MMQNVLYYQYVASFSILSIDLVKIDGFHEFWCMLMQKNDINVEC